MYPIQQMEGTLFAMFAILLAEDSMRQQLSLNPECRGLDDAVSPGQTESAMVEDRCCR